VGLRHVSSPEKLWARELARVSLTALLPFLLFFGTLFFRQPVVRLLLALTALLKPLLRIPRFMKQYRITFDVDLLYAVHTAFVVYPQFLGILRYLRTSLGGTPLLNWGRIAR